MCFTCVSRVLHVFTTCVTRGCPWAKFWAVQNFLPRPTPLRFFSASCHVYKSTVARLKLDINANNIVCFTGDDFLTGFGRDQAVKRCVTGSLHMNHDSQDSGHLGQCNTYLRMKKSFNWFQMNTSVYHYVKHVQNATLIKSLDVDVEQNWVNITWVLQWIMSWLTS